MKWYDISRRNMKWIWLEILVNDFGERLVSAIFLLFGFFI